jgi:simple sugar transport system ATP-binding protein
MLGARPGFRDAGLTAADAPEVIGAVPTGGDAQPGGTDDVRPAPLGDVVVRADRLRVVDAAGVERVRDASFELRAGELVGVAAVEGSGQHELLRALAGRIAPAGGVLERPADVAFIPEDRHRDAMLLAGSVAENVALRGSGRRRGRLAWRAIRAQTRALLDAFDVRGGQASTPAAALSGGNQQKLVVARELSDSGTMVALIVAENPTRGLDIRAAAAVRDRLRTARATGAAVVVYSSDLDEVIALADRVLVVHSGRVSTAPREPALVGRLLLGADPEPGAPAA